MDTQPHRPAPVPQRWERPRTFPPGQWQRQLPTKYLTIAARGDVPADPTTAGPLCRRLMNLEVSAVLDVADLAPDERRRCEDECALLLV